MTPLVSKVRGDVSPKKSLAFTATKSEYLRRFWVFRTVIPRNEPLGAPDIISHKELKRLSCGGVQNCSFFRKKAVESTARHGTARHGTCSV